MAYIDELHNRLKMAEENRAAAIETRNLVKTRYNTVKGIYDKLSQDYAENVERVNSWLNKAGLHMETAVTGTALAMRASAELEGNVEKYPNVDPRLQQAQNDLQTEVDALAREYENRVSEIKLIDGEISYLRHEIWAEEWRIAHADV